MTRPFNVLTRQSFGRPCPQRCQAENVKESGHCWNRAMMMPRVSRIVPFAARNACLRGSCQDTGWRVRRISANDRVNELTRFCGFFFQEGNQDGLSSAFATPTQATVGINCGTPPRASRHFSSCSIRLITRDIRSIVNRGFLQTQLLALRRRSNSISIACWAISTRHAGGYHRLIFFIVFP